VAARGDDLVVEPLERRHARSAFACGVEPLDHYLRTQAGQDVRRKANAVFVLRSADAPASGPTPILGFYTLCALALPQGDVPVAARRHVPRYPLVSATLIGRLAVARDRQGTGLGAVLLADALGRALRSADTVGSSMVVVDAIDARAVAFCESHGFVRLPDCMRLILPMRLIGDMLGR